MSTHTLDVSGARPLTSTTNDPARTAASTSAKAGDDVVATISGGREIRLELPANARIQRRQYPTRSMVYENGSPKKVDGDYVYQEGTETRIVLVLPGSTTLFLRSSTLAVEGEEPPPYEPTPHTAIYVKRWTELYALESGEMLSEVEVGEALADQPDLLAG